MPRQRKQCLWARSRLCYTQSHCRTSGRAAALCSRALQAASAVQVCSAQPRPADAPRPSACRVPALMVAAGRNTGSASPVQKQPHPFYARVPYKCHFVVWKTKGNTTMWSHLVIDQKSYHLTWLNSWLFSGIKFTSQISSLF